MDLTHTVDLGGVFCMCVGKSVALLNAVVSKACSQRKFGHRECLVIGKVSVVTV